MALVSFRLPAAGRAEAGDFSASLSLLFSTLEPFVSLLPLRLGSGSASGSWLWYVHEHMSSTRLYLCISLVSSFALLRESLGREKEERREDLAKETRRRESTETELIIKSVSIHQHDGLSVTRELLIMSRKSRSRLFLFETEWVAVIALPWILSSILSAMLALFEAIEPTPPCLPPPTAGARPAPPAGFHNRSKAAVGEGGQPCCLRTKPRHPS